MNRLHSALIPTAPATYTVFSQPVVPLTHQLINIEKHVYQLKNYYKKMVREIVSQSNFL